MFDLRKCDLGRLNSLTKYPSIPTYHNLDPRSGCLVEPCIRFDGPVSISEKLDGTNGRIIFTPDGGWLIGGREEFLYGHGDLIGDMELGIVEALRPIAERFSRQHVQATWPTHVVVAFFEVYGGGVGGARAQYSSTGTLGARLFDVVTVADYEKLLELPRDKISSWRQHGGQQYLSTTDLFKWAGGWEIAAVPVLGSHEHFADLTVVEADQLLQAVLRDGSRAKLDESAGGKPEGIVIRSHDRKTIAKLRLEDYDRTLRPRQKQKKQQAVQP